MSLEHTEQQSSEAQRRAKDLSLRSTTPPIEVPGYDTQKFLGSGAFGEVWTALDQNTGRRVAIKFYTHRGSVDWTLLSREVEKLRVLAADRYVVQLLEVGWDSDPPYYVMDYIENGSLEDRLKAEGTLPLNDAVDLFQEVAVGLMHLHGKGVLHCDLKPANVLLDEDEKPRLADFGQSRLSHEQKPALGTLFYMAPEQADLEAVPDARWDVYALGALLYCMLTGNPPFRTKAIMTEVDSAASLPARLKHYRESIKASPSLTGHKQIPGIDRSLVEIIERCLAVNPDKRFQSVQSVLEALKTRDEAKMRKPLLLLGVVAPVVLLIIMIYFGLTGYYAAVKESYVAVSARVQQNNNTFAESVARAIEAEIPRYFRAVERESRREEFRQLFSAVVSKPILHDLRVSKSEQNKVSKPRDVFLEDEDRIKLLDYFQNRLNTYLDAVKKYYEQDDQSAGQPPLDFASLFATNADGTILAVAYDTPDTASSSEGKNYAYRTYYHGGPDDLPLTTRPGDVAPIKGTHLSTVFQSTSTGKWKIGVSTPVYAEAVENGVGDPSAGRKLLGIVVMTIDLGDFSPFRKRDPKHFGVLVDNRAGKSKGTILHHDFYQQGEGENDPEKDGAKDLDKPFFADLDQFKEKRNGEYYDPLAKAEGGEAYRGRWIAAMEWVHLPNDSAVNGADVELASPDFAVIVQESYQETVKPVESLGRSLLWRTALSAVGFVLVVSVQWYFVLRMIGGLKRINSRYSNDRTITTNSLHNMKTQTAPSPGQE